MHYKFMFATICALMLAHSTLAAAQISLSLGDVSAPVGSVVAMPLVVDSANPGASSLVLNLTFNPAELSVAGVELESSVTGLGKSLQHRVQPGQLSMSIFGGVAPYEAATLATVYWKLNPEVGSGATVSVGSADSSAASPAADAVGVQITSGEIAVSSLGGQHSADYQKNWSLSLSELLRVIQFFNSDAIHCDALSEDGYKPGAGDTACGNHNSDYNMPDWKINLSELLRAIQFYNSIGSAYHPDAGGEDGFNPGPFGG